MGASGKGRGAFVRKIAAATAVAAAFVLLIYLLSDSALVPWKIFDGDVSKAVSERRPSIRLARDHVRPAADGETSLPPPPEDKEANHRAAVEILKESRKRSIAPGSLEVEQYRIGDNGRSFTYNRWRRLNDPARGSFNRFDWESYRASEDEPDRHSTLIVTPDGFWKIFDDVAYRLTDPGPWEEATRIDAAAGEISAEHLEKIHCSYRNAVINGREGYLITTEHRDGPTFTMAMDAETLFPLGMVKTGKTEDDLIGEHLYRIVSDEPLDRSLFVVPEGMKMETARDVEDADAVHRANYEWRSSDGGKS